jgi:hypothetical protein
MPKPRDYKAEQARRSVTKMIEIDPALSFWRQSNLITLLNFIPEDELYSAINEHKISDTGVFQLLEIARVKPEEARDLLKNPKEIGDTYRLLNCEVSVLRSRRVSAADRIERAWPGVWQRWLQKFDPSDHQFVRKECARRILDEIV